MASAASTVSLQDVILSNGVSSVSTVFTDYLSIWPSAFDPLRDNLPSKQPCWDRPGVLADGAMLEAALTTPLQRTFYLAASSPHSGDWLMALPIASCGLRLDDEAVRVAVGIRLDLPVCVPHQCRCGMQADALGIHSFVCNRAPGRTARHQALNELIAGAFTSADIYRSSTSQVA